MFFEQQFLNSGMKLPNGFYEVAKKTPDSSWIPLSLLKSKLSQSSSDLEILMVDPNSDPNLKAIQSLSATKKFSSFQLSSLFRGCRRVVLKYD
jgi:hypothetical protein